MPMYSELKAFEYAGQEEEDEEENMEEDGQGRGERHEGCRARCTKRLLLLQVARRYKIREGARGGMRTTALLSF